MTYSNKTNLNFSGGEATPRIQARTDIPLFNKVLTRCQNWIVEPQGPVRFRNGFVYVHHTKLNRRAVWIPFQFSDIQSYLIEATEQCFRFYKDGGVILETAKNITGITQANPGVVTSNTHGYVTGDEIYISGIAGMTELNGRFLLVVRIDANTYSLTDEFGTAINTTTYTAYSSGGTTERIYEVITPYLEADLSTLKYSQNADTMYITHVNYEPRKLTRTTETNWSLARYVRTADPFTTAKTITGITQANPGVVTATAHGFATGNQVYIDSVVGMTQVNNTHFTINVLTANTFELKDLNGNNVNTTGYTAWSSGGKAELYNSRVYPRAVNFTDDGRLAFGGTLNKPETLWFSKGPTAAGAVQFDDFTTGSNATDALIFTLAPLRGKVDSIRWITNTDKYIAIGTFGSIRRMYGGTEAEPITPSSVTAKSANADGVAETLPIVDGPAVFYIDRTSLTLQSVEYNYQIDGYEPNDQNLVSDHITNPGLSQVLRQVSRPTVLWVLRSDGVALGLTYKAKENIAGWHRHKTGGSGVIESMGILPRPSAQDQLWATIKRTINGHTVRYNEYLADKVSFPDIKDFFTGDKASDKRKFLNAQYEVLKTSNHLDASATYNGSDYGSAVSATLTVGAGGDVIDTTGVTFTASAAVFNSGMVGRQIWGKYDSAGEGGGRVLLTGYSSTTVMTGTILDPFPAAEVFAAGDWFITATEISSLGYLEGETVQVVADGIALGEFEVEDGVVTIDQPGSVIQIGLAYLGMLETFPLDQGGVSGPAQSKPKNVAKLSMRFVDSAGLKFGTDLYRLTQVDFGRTEDLTGRPTPLYNGFYDKYYSDSWNDNKSVFIVQDRPVPTTLAAIDVYMETTDE